jgi:hypothetical protein
MYDIWAQKCCVSLHDVMGSHRNGYYAMLLVLRYYCTARRYGNHKSIWWSAHCIGKVSARIFCERLFLLYFLFIFSPSLLSGYNLRYCQILESVYQCFHPIGSGAVGERSHVYFMGLIFSCSTGKYVYSTACFNIPKLCILPARTRTHTHTHTHMFRTILTINRFPSPTPPQTTSTGWSL